MPNYIVTEELKDYATAAIKSFRDSWKDFELIVVDDGSPMDTTFLKELADIYIRNEKNSGFAISCNNGFKRAFKELGDENGYIVCANNDIEVYPRSQEELIFPHNEFDNVAITGICHRSIKEVDGKHLSEIRESKIVEGGQAAVMQDGGLWMSTKKVLKKVGLFDEQFIRGGLEDVDLFLRMRDTFGMKIIMSQRAWYYHAEGKTRWNQTKNEYINNFNITSKQLEAGNMKKFQEKWGRSQFNWNSNELVS